MVSQSISFVTLLTIHFGFAAFLGVLITRSLSLLQGAMLGIASVLYVVATFTLPMPARGHIVVLSISLLLAAIFASRYHRGVYQNQLAWAYTGLAMSLVFLWSLSQGLHYPILSLGGAAAWQPYSPGSGVLP